MDISESGLFLIVFAAVLPMLLAVAVPILIGFYFIRRSEIGAELAGREIKKSAVILLVAVPSILIFAFLFVLLFERSGIETFFIFLIGALIVFIIAYPVYWWSRLRQAKKSELFQVPVKASNLVLVIAILWSVLAFARFGLFFISFEPIELLLGLSQILLGALIGYTWFRPTWHITEEGIFLSLGSIKWKNILSQEWLPKNDKEVLLRLDIKRWWLPFKLPFTQVFPIEYERPLKAIIQKHLPQGTSSPPLGDESSTVF